MSRSISAEVNPTVFKWLRESAGWSIEDVSMRLRTSIEVVQAIEAGEREPTLRQLRELSTAYKRPIAAFFLAEPRQEKARPADYRMLTNKRDMFEKRTLLALRQARMLQEIGAQLLRNTGRQTTPAVERVRVTDDPERIAAEYRTAFQFTEDVQKKAATAYEVFNYLRSRLEDLNILVFQDAIPLEDARGFALTDEKPNVIVLSSQDTIEARVFSIIHEFGHILLGEGAIDMPDYASLPQDRIEAWCNTFASRFLLPTDIAVRTFTANRPVLTESATLNALSRRFKLSKGMLLFTMVRLGFISRPVYNEVLERYRPQVPEIEDEIAEDEDGREGGGMAADVKCLSRVGNRFVALVAENYDANQITYTDALNYLAIRTGNFDRVLARARQ